MDLAELGPALFDWSSDDVRGAVESIRSCSLVVVASPTYKASYTGLLKSFLDWFSTTDLLGVTVVPVMTGAAPHHALAVEVHLRPVLVELGATLPTRGLYVTEAELPESQARHRRLAAHGRTSAPARPVVPARRPCSSFLKGPMASSDQPRLDPVPFAEWDEETRTTLLPFLRRPERYLSGATDAPPMPIVLEMFAHHLALERVVAPVHRHAGRIRGAPGARAPRAPHPPGGVAHALGLRVDAAQPHGRRRRAQPRAGRGGHGGTVLPGVDAAGAGAGRGGRRAHRRPARRRPDLVGAGRAPRAGRALRGPVRGRGATSASPACSTASACRARSRRPPVGAPATTPSGPAGAPQEGSSTTRTAPLALSEATRNASSASSIGKRWVIRVRAMSGSWASMRAASSISRPFSWAQ